MIPCPFITYALTNRLLHSFYIHTCNGASGAFMLVFSGWQLVNFNRLLEDHFRTFWVLRPKISYQSKNTHIERHILNDKERHPDGWEGEGEGDRWVYAGGGGTIPSSFFVWQVFLLDLELIFLIVRKTKLTEEQLQQLNLIMATTFLHQFLCFLPKEKMQFLSYTVKSSKRVYALRFQAKQRYKALGIQRFNV